MSTDKSRRRFVSAIGALGATGLAGCLSGGDDSTATSEDEMTDGEMTDGEMTDGEMTDGEDEMGMEPMDPTEADAATVDRFSEDAGTLMVRSDENGLPGADEPIDFDAKPFFHQGLGPDGEIVQYYNFDVHALSPAPIFKLVREDSGDPVEGQLNIVGVKPGDDGYNDFWQVHKVEVSSEYEANSLTDVSSIMDGDYSVEKTRKIVNCPVVPEGSTASKRAGDAGTGLTQGWYDGKTVSYLTFAESPLTAENESVPLSPIYVTFNENPGEDGGGPPSGFVTEDGSAQNHNVVGSLPGDDDYSPLWLVNIYDNADFGSVSDLDSAKDAEILARGAANVNCPLVSVEA